MRLNPIRRSQLVSPFGPGALHILEGGISVLTGGLDDWFKDEAGNFVDSDEINKGGLLVREPRLEEQLDVSHFRVAPGPENRDSIDEPLLKTPVFRFPTWFICPRCSSMKKSNLYRNGFLTCQNDGCKRARMFQIRFAAVCDHGHLQDFPWLEWVHRSGSSQALAVCSNSLEYRAEGSGSLDSIKIVCKKCNISRPLGGVMQGELQPSAKDPNGWSGLSRLLLATRGEGEDNRAQFLCQGEKSWQGEVPHDQCQRPLRAVLINATNVYYSDVRSAIHIPPKYRPSASDLSKILDESKFRNKITMWRRADDDIEAIVGKLRKNDTSDPLLLEGFTDDQIETALKGHDEAPPSAGDSEELPSGDRAEQEDRIRRDEYEAFLGETDRESRLVLREVNLDALPELVDCMIERVVAIDRLRETRVLAGFSRLVGKQPKDAPKASELLWRECPGSIENRWLPAAIVHGEGIFMKFREDKLAAWETNENVLRHLAPMQRNQSDCAIRYGWEDTPIEPRFVLLHTLAHMIINRLVFECGYGSASLRERLYISNDENQPMAGILIYTAAGDSEGTMGGLVKLADAEALGRIISNAIEEAQWCSADPVCAEAAFSGGQGPDSLNLASCHSCGLLPETSCEQFNKYLDRTLWLEDHTVSFLKAD